MLTSPVQLYKNAYSGLSRNSWYLCLVMLVNRSGTMVIPFMSIYCIRVLHFSITQAGYIMGLFGLGSVFGAFIGGKLTDKIGFYDLQIAALSSGGLLFIAAGYAHTFTSLAVSAFVLSFCNESFRPANSSAIAFYSNAENKTRSYSLNRLAVNLGWAVGGGLGGFLASYSYHSLFWVDGCTNVIAAALLLKLIPRAAVVKPVKRAVNNIIITSPYRDKVYLLFIILVMIFASCFFQLFGMQPLFYKTVWLLNERIIGFLMALNGILIVVIEMVLIHRIEGKKNPLIYISMGLLLTGAGFVLLNLLPGSVLTGLTVVVFLTFGEMFAMPFMNSFWIVRTSDNNRGAYAALYTMAWSTAQVIARTLGSQVVLFGGFGLLWWLAGAVCAIAAAGFIVLYKFLSLRQQN